jgi:hypothetical protein
MTMIDTEVIDTDTFERSQRDVVFTPIMLRVREAVHGTGESGAPASVRVSVIHPIAEANDEWVYLRCRGEQVIAEANSMIQDPALPRFELVDEIGIDAEGAAQLAFVVSYGPRSFRLWLAQSDRRAWIELERSWVPTTQQLEPTDPAVLEDLLVDILARERTPA